MNICVEGGEIYYHWQYSSKATVPIPKLLTFDQSIIHTDVLAFSRNVLRSIFPVGP
jgi:hypothetical protein